MSACYSDGNMILGSAPKSFEKVAMVHAHQRKVLSDLIASGRRDEARRRARERILGAGIIDSNGRFVRSSEE